MGNLSRVKYIELPTTKMSTEITGKIIRNSGIGGTFTFSWFHTANSLGKNR